MRLGSVGRVKNEADIIEAFVRHNAQFLDFMILVDDESRDNTYDILKELRSEGLPLILRREALLGTGREHVYAALMRQGFEDHEADWIVFLDADEFIEVDEGKTLRSLLAENATSLVKLPWNNFAWSADGADDDGDNPVETMTKRLAGRSVGHEKIVVPRWLGSNQSAVPAKGNHDVLLDGRPHASTILDRAKLCHYPIRSADQYKGKAAIASLKYILSGNLDDQVGLQYKGAFEAIISGDEEGLPALLETLSRRYPPYPPTAADAEITLAPLRYLGGALRFAQKRLPASSLVLSLAREIAVNSFSQATTIEALERSLSLASHQFSGCADPVVP